MGVVQVLVEEIDVAMSPYTTIIRHSRYPRTFQRSKVHLKERIVYDVSFANIAIAAIRKFPKNIG